MLRQPSALLVDEVRRGKASNWTAGLDGSGPTTPRRRPDRTAGSACCPTSTSTSLRVSAGNACTRTATTATRRRGRPCRRGHGGDGDTDRGRRDSQPARLSQRTTRSERRCRTSVLVALSPSRRSVGTCALPNIHLCWLYGWFGRLRSDRPVMAGQRARMPAHRATRALPARTRAVPRGGRAARLHRQPIPRALTTLPEPASGASLFRKPDAVAVPTARLLPAPGSTSAISRRSPAATSAPGCRRCSARWSRVGTRARTGTLRSSTGPAIRRPAGPGPPPAVPVTSTSPLTRSLPSVPRRLAQQNYNQ